MSSRAGPALRDRPRATAGGGPTPALGAAGSKTRPSQAVEPRANLRIRDKAKESSFRMIYCGIAGDKVGPRNVQG